MMDQNRFQLSGEAVRAKLLKCGKDVKLNEFCKICMPQVVILDDNCRICDFAFIWGGRGVRIGKYTDVQPNVVVWGGGELVVGDYVSIGTGTTLLTATYAHKEGLRMVDGQPEGDTHALYGKLIVENDVYIGANSTLMPNVVVGEGSIIGANSLVNKNVEPWGIYVGSPAKKIGERPRLNVS